MKKVLIFMLMLGVIGSTATLTLRASPPVEQYNTISFVSVETSSGYTTTTTSSGLPRLDNWLNGLFEDMEAGAFYKVLLMVILTVVVATILALQGVPYIIVLISTIMLGILYVVLGWLSAWIMILIGIGLIFMLIISIKKGGD